MKSGKTTEIAEFIQIPLFDVEKFKKGLTVGYHKNPRTGEFDLKKASLKISKDLLTPYSNCLKHLEVSGSSLPRESDGSKSSTSANYHETKPSNETWLPFGSGRQFGDR